MQEGLETQENTQQTNKHGNSDVHALHCDTILSLLCGSQLLKLLTCSNKEWFKYRVMQRGTKCV